VIVTISNSEPAHRTDETTEAAPARVGRRAARLDGERSREKILDAAERLFAARGYAGSGIAAISRESGLPPSSIYWFFDSKQDLAVAVISRAADRWLAALRLDGVVPEHGAFRHFMERALEQSGSRLPEFVRLQMLLALELGTTEPEVLKQLREVLDRGRSFMSETLAVDLAGIDEKRGPALAEDLAVLSMSFAQGALLSRMMEPETIDAERLGEDIEVAIQAIAAHRLARLENV
jgi:AcrR family transcriptional regulator